MLVLVDGLNLFHSLRSQDPQNTNLNVTSLSKIIAKNYGCEVSKIIFVAALVEHLDRQSRQRQFDYIENLRLTGVQILTTEFCSQIESCNTCGALSRRYVEKQTDVSIAVNLIAGVLQEELAQVLLFSADTDFLPALIMAKALQPDLEVRVAATPAYLRPVYGLFRKAGIGTIRLSPELVSKHLF